MNVVITLSLIGAVLFALAGVGVGMITPERIPLANRFVRNRNIGVVAGAVALIFAAPQLVAISWDWVASSIWYMIAGILVLFYFFGDFVNARAMAGLLMVGAYYFINHAFVQDITALPIMAFFTLAWAVIGLMVAAWPHVLRDFLRRCAEKCPLRYSAIGVLWATAFAYAVCGILAVVGHGNI